MSSVQISIVGMLDYDPDLFADLPIPDGVDLDAVVYAIANHCSEWPLLLVNGPALKVAIRQWGVRRQKVWADMWRSITAEYNPIHNYDRDETIERTVTGSSEGSGTSTRTAYDTDDQKPTGGSSSTGSSEGHEIVHTKTAGNIGVTTAPAMLREFREISDFTIYDYIAADFAREFCVQVY